MGSPTMIVAVDDTDWLGYPIVFEDTYSEIKVQLVYLMIASAIQWFIYTFLTRASYDDRIGVASIYLWNFTCPVMCYWAMKSTYANINAGPEIRINQTDGAGVSFMRSYVSLQAMGLVNEVDFPKWKTHPRHQLETVGHHLFSMISYEGALLVFHRFWFIAIMAGLSECSTIFLNYVLLSKKESHKDFIQAYFQPFITFCGLMLWLCFIFFRLILFPATIFIFVSDAFSDTEHSKNVTQFEIGFYLSTLTFLFILSVVWFGRIHKGMMKAVFGVGGAKSKELTAEAAKEK